MNIIQSAILWWQRHREVADLRREVKDLKEEVQYLRRERAEDRDELRRVQRRLDHIIDGALGVQPQEQPQQPQPQLPEQPQQPQQPRNAD